MQKNDEHTDILKKRLVNEANGIVMTVTASYPSFNDIATVFFYTKPWHQRVQSLTMVISQDISFVIT